MTAPASRKAAALALVLALAPAHEGLKLTPYYDPPGILTVCYGHTGPDVVKDRRYSLDECKKFLSQDAREAIETVERCVPGLPVPVLAAFGDAVFNSGPKIACDTKTSTAARLLKAGALKGACNQLPRWNKARVFGVMTELPGLTKRREEERLLCLQGAPS